MHISECATEADMSEEMPHIKQGVSLERSMTTPPNYAAPNLPRPHRDFQPCPSSFVIMSRYDAGNDCCTKDCHLYKSSPSFVVFVDKELNCITCT